MSPLDAENANYLWTQLLFAEWRRLGLRRVVVCPGSRSSPLAIAAARTDGLETAIAFDERCAGFIALGAAKVDGVPTAVVTTSGSAVANLLPALVEAATSGTPLLAATADRPFELRHCGANQTIEQSRIFGAFARWSVDLPPPDAAFDPALVLSTADEAWARAMARPAGPVHLNCAFREPLAPTRGQRPAVDARLRSWWKAGTPWRSEPQREAAALEDDEPLGSSRRTIVIAGSGAQDPAGLAEKIGGPLLADATVAGAIDESAVPAVDLVLAALADERCAALRARLRPDLVLRLGGPLASKRLNEFAASAERVVVERTTQRFDERHRAEAVLPRGWRPMGTRRGDPAFAELWRRVGIAAAAASEAAFAAMGDDAPLVEPLIAHELPKSARDGVLVVGSSMPVRDLDAFRPREQRVERIIANRGASGIDGTISTAVGCAASGRPTTVLLGDLALLHDLGGLAYVRGAPRPLHVVVVNNDGGGIFHFLPIASEPAAEAHFERLFGTPHGLSFAGAASMFGLEHAIVRTAGEARSAFAALVDAERPRLVECMTDRTTNVAAHRAVQRAVADALARAFG
jgi:2-succinyl-5-enolpyruvyl-6-hydroxy-3-cyclohexene-1-carboxylate synthase